MALSARARKRLEVAMARRAEAKEIADTIDSMLSTEVGGALDEAQILVGNASDLAAAVDLSGDATIDKDGVLTLAADSVVTANITDLNVTTGKLAAAAVTKAKALVSVSAEQTGTGASQNVAHGLGATPSIVLVAITEGDGEAFDVAEGAHGTTNVVVTVTTGVKFKVLAWA